ncbi:DUF1311 domain-containing protein [Ramlibacter sp. AW1]|uniref:DUF1311 domain-containing protein n=1 Tax=Ramlibacter aurantiacus TaxID=2801330 RepID=A0A936ZZ34_9BURK|nr:lysozyme inhibitor LprI family protein [Ramlibacter aurantiacus]MBL0423104.1 DUF1311 domain-containing protein [Ramlibacter aurantiacus]
MSYSSHALLAVLAVACPATAAAQNCRHAMTQGEMNECAAQDHAREDARLNDTYRDLASKLKPAQRDKLRSVQRVWLSYRDMNCDFRSAAYQGGTIYPLVRSMCLAEMTSQRTEDLKARLEEADR